MSDASRLKATVYVGGLDNAVTTHTLHAAFVPFGEIVDVNLPKPELPSSTDPHRGFGYVEFEHATDAKEAIDNMDQSELYGRVIKVAAAKPQKDQTEGLGSKTAVWEQEGWLAKHAVSEEDRAGAERGREGSADGPMDPMQGLEGLDEAGPKLA
ncbi:putative peptidyl prolyl cis-trans isomerase cyclophilin [Zopfia rhizophila CBS 207.26]|uniref:Putative peptidyl prolyl cis-trans isomerase cyclophilin n=1 Tax=Zopfia rhizophila CBS 207.26 TaxID=1314779 RepID=A0A6A6EGZ9_9PEZI|nr:putative peptidyl prolyl cis-trans isomerase cyclophilin [Zopfia rhizophila CBS 207.26]